MKKLFIFCVFCMLSLNFLYSQSQSKNLIGFSSGIVPGMMDMYFGQPWDFSPNRELSPVIQFFYARQLHKIVRLGAYVEMEKVKFSDQTGTDRHSFRRNNIGINGLLQFPQKPLHLQIGGYIGYGYLRADNWDDLTGLDFGGMGGPAYEKGKFGLAAHLQTGYANYESSGTPKQVKLYNPKVLLKFYYKF